MDKVRFGIVGFGNKGTGHAKNLMDGKIENGVLTAVCDTNPKKLEICREKYGEKVKYYNGKTKNKTMHNVNCSF